jgi:uncharacterized repeat protein (TIGR03803 family)
MKTYRSVLLLLVLAIGGFAGTSATVTLASPSQPAPALQVLYVFPNDLSSGGGLGTPLTLGADGAFYGSSAYGGQYQYFGTLFRFCLDGTFTKLLDLNLTNGLGSSIPLQLGADGALYGACSMGGTKGDYWNRGYGSGLLFRLETNGNYTVLHEFDYVDGDYPAWLQAGPDGAFYGTTLNGGAHNYGTFFRIDTNGWFASLHDFDFAPGILVFGTLTLAADGDFYGSMSARSADNPGSIIRLHPNGEMDVLHTFDGINGFTPVVPLTVGADGALYGVATAWGNLDGVILFRIGLDGEFSKLHDVIPADGFAPNTALTLCSDGCLYGTFQLGGANGLGTVFQINRDGNFVKLHDFDGSDGATPMSQLAVASDGALYGGTFSGGAYDLGTLYRVDTNGVFAKLYDANGTNGYGQFISPLISGPDGNLYASAPYGGDNLAGVLFRLVLNPASLSPIEQLEQLLTTVNTRVARPRPLAVLLQAALDSVQRGNKGAAITQLAAFEQAVRAQITRQNSALAQDLTSSASDIIARLKQ